MMRTCHNAFLGLAALAATPALAQHQHMDGMAGMDMSAPAARTGQGRGVITAIDLKAGSLTIRHEPIQALNWPAMTMTFKANPSALLKGLTVGQRIGFDVKAQGMAAEITAVRPL
ncbi:copper-binding protein (plasmid) [Rhizorhabdus wittichii]